MRDRQTGDVGVSVLIMETVQKREIRRQMSAGPGDNCVTFEHP
jgi:hypothetical protein